MPVNDRNYMLDTKISAISAIIDHGIFWISEMSYFSDRLFDNVSGALVGKNLHKVRDNVAFDYVLVDCDRHPDWPTWLNKHAATRQNLLMQGIPYDQLPPTP